MQANNKEIKIIFILITGLFAVFLMVPLVTLFGKSIAYSGGVGIHNYKALFKDSGFIQSLQNSFSIAALSSTITVLIAFFLAFSIHYTNLPKAFKKTISLLTLLPMLLPTITYGFAIIYSFGKQGLITKLLGFQLFDIYGQGGLILGYVIYTLPIAFLLLSSAMAYIDKRFIVVSRLMGDKPLKTFQITLLRPIVGSLGMAFVQSFFLSFTDFGIPASIGGEFPVVATTLYNVMLGSIPNFASGSSVAMIMLLPSVASVALLTFLERFNFRYAKVKELEPDPGKTRDVLCGIFSGGILLAIFSIFLVILLVPFVKMWPYEIVFTWEHMQRVFTTPALARVYTNSLFVAFITAVAGTIICYGAAIVTARSALNNKLKVVVDSIALIINTVPGMVLGLSYLFVFSGTSLQTTFTILIICNIVHFFSTPYLMLKSALSKLSASFETTAMLMGDSWLRSIIRVITPNVKVTLLDSFGYLFVNAMVTISAVIFIAGARTMVITTKIKELQYLAKFDEIFALSVLILCTNLFVKLIIALIEKAIRRRKNVVE